MDIGERIKKAMDDAGLSQADVARGTGYTKAAVNNWLNRGAKDVRNDALFALADLTGKSARWIATGQGPEKSTDSPPPTESRIYLRDVPVVGNVQGGNGDDGYWEAMDYPVGHGDGYIEWNTADPNAYAVECRGDSMAPRIRHGEFVIAEPNAQIEPGEEVIVIGRNGKKMVKVLDYRRGGRVYLSSINQDHPQFSLDDSEIEAIHATGGIAPRRARKQ